MTDDGSEAFGDHDRDEDGVTVRPECDATGPLKAFRKLPDPEGRIRDCRTQTIVSQPGLVRNSLRCQDFREYVASGSGGRVCFLDCDGEYSTVRGVVLPQARITVGQWF